MKWNELRSICRRHSDYIITLFVTNELSLGLTYFLKKTPVTPNQVTVASFICGIICGICYGLGWFLLGSLFLFLAHVLDCTDGNLARAKKLFSPLGKFLDFIGDRITLMAVLFGASFYFFRNGEALFWTVFPLITSELILLYNFIVNMASVLQISKQAQQVTTLMFKGVHIKWGTFEPTIYGFIILAPMGLLKIQVVLVFLLLVIGLMYQFVKLSFCRK